MQGSRMRVRLEKIIARLQSIRRQALLVRWGLGLLVFLSLIFFILNWAWLTARLGRGFLALGVCFFGAFILGLVALGVWFKRTYLDIERTALLCEKKFPILGDGLISLVQLGRSYFSGSVDFSLALFEKHLEQMEEKLGQIRLEQVIGARRLLIPGVVFSILFFLWVGLWSFSAGFSESIKSSILLSGLNFNKAVDRVRVSKSLALYDFVIEYHYPEYSGLESKRIEGGDGSLSGLVGSEVRVQAHSSVLLDRAWVKIPSEERINASISGNQIFARIILSKMAQYRIEAEDKNGDLWIESGYHQITIIPDNSPMVELIFPDQDQVVSLEDKIKIKFQARDDFGLEAIALVFTSKGKEKRILIKEFSPGAMESQAEYEWDLSLYNLMPGERVAYYLEAKDNNNVSGPGIGKSETRYLEVFSPLKNHEKIIAEEQELFDALIYFLGRSIVSDLGRKDLVQFWQEEGGLIKGLEGIQERLLGLKPKLADDPYSTDLVREAVAQQTERYRNLLTLRRNSYRSQNQKSAIGLRANTIEVLERDILFWDRELKKQRMEFLAELGERLKQGEQELSRLIEEYQRTQDPSLLSEIEERLEELKLVYQEFLERMGELSQTLADEFINLDALKKTASREVYGSLEKFRQSVHDRDMGNALKNAEDFLEGLRAMLSELEEGSEAMGSSISSELLSQLDKQLEGLRELIQEEGGLIGRTEPIYQSWLKEAEKAHLDFEKDIESLSKELNALEENLRARVEEFRPIQPSSKTGANELKSFYQERSLLDRGLWDLLRELEQAKKLAEQNQLEGALDSLERISEQLAGMDNRLENFFKNSNQTQTEKQAFEQGIGSCQKQAEGLKRGFNKVMKDREGFREGAFLQELNKLALEQQMLKGRLIHLQGELEALFEQFPVYPKRAPEYLNKAELKMKDAEDELRRGNSELGLINEKEAKHWLEQAEADINQFKDKLKQKAKRMPFSVAMPRGGGRPGGFGKEGGLGFRDEDFKLPGKEANRDPVEMRKKILKAMKEGSPKEYEELNRDYYKRLVQ